MALSFSRKAKQEIIDNKSYRQRAETAQAYGLFLFSQAFTQSRMVFSTELLDLHRLYIWFLRRLLGKQVRLEATEQLSRGKTVYRLTIKAAADREKLRELFAAEHMDTILTGEQELDAFCSGAFMACGSIADPNRAYHLELAVRSAELADKLRGIIESRIAVQPGLTSRRALSIIYLKDCEQLQDLLTLMGASKAALELIDIEMIKEVRNRANRVTNCETANIDKLVEAATKQAEDIELVLSELGEGGISVALLSAARLRLEHPEASLRELCELSPEPVSRSGMHHRYAALSKLAGQIRDNRKNIYKGN